VADRDKVPERLDVGLDEGMSVSDTDTVSELVLRSDPLGVTRMLFEILLDLEAKGVIVMLSRLVLDPD